MGSAKDYSVKFIGLRFSKRSDWLTGSDWLVYVFLRVKSTSLRVEPWVPTF